LTSERSEGFSGQVLFLDQLSEAKENQMAEEKAKEKQDTPDFGTKLSKVTGKEENIVGRVKLNCNKAAFWSLDVDLNLEAPIPILNTDGKVVAKGADEADVLEHHLTIKNPLGKPLGNLSEFVLLAGIQTGQIIDVHNTLGAELMFSDIETDDASFRARYNAVVESLIPQPAKDLIDKPLDVVTQEIKKWADDLLLLGVRKIIAQLSEMINKGDDRQLVQKIMYIRDREGRDMNPRKSLLEWLDDKLSKMNGYSFIEKETVEVKSNATNS